jgi:predicted aspartyl protease
MHASAQGTDKVVTVPMVLELDRPYVDLRLTGPSNIPVIARAWLDTGGGSLLFSAGLAQRLGLKATQAPAREEGEVMAPTTMPTIAIGKKIVVPKGVNAIILVDAPDKLMHTDAEVAVPVRMLRDYHVVFDYPASKLTIADAGALAPVGQPVKTFIGSSGMPVVTATMDGKAQQFLLDTGATYTMISQAAQDTLSGAHAGWLRARPAYGPANMLADDARDKMLVLDALELGALKLISVGTVSRPAGVFEKWMSQTVGVPIVGSLGGNVLGTFRVDIDYPGRQVYLTPGTRPADPHVDIVPITLGASPEGYVIAAADARATGLEVGDVILGVGDLDARTATLSAMIQALSGRIGEKKILTVLRGPDTSTLTATVVRVL